MHHLQITTPDVLPDEPAAEAALRPSRLDEFVGQEQVRQSLQIAIDAARARGDTLDHILFFDEIHRMRPTLEEFLYPAMEDFRVDVRIAEGPNAQTIPMQLERFTLIGATTRFGLLTPPMRARFGIVERLSFYPPEDLQTIVTRSATILGVPIDD